MVQDNRQLIKFIILLEKKQDLLYQTIVTGQIQKTEPISKSKTNKPIFPGHASQAVVLSPTNSEQSNEYTLQVTNVKYTKESIREHCNALIMKKRQVHSLGVNFQLVGP